MANVLSNFASWSTTANSNEPDSSADAATVRGDLQQIQATVRKALAYKGSDLASASTVDLSNTDGFFHDVTGTSAITALGTASAGITKVLKFEGALTFTHNATSLIIPGAASITTANGDMCQVTSEGGGNWRVNWYFHADGRQVKAFTGDSGSGGVIGLVPAPSAGDAAASKFLKADGTWAAAGGSSSSSSRNYVINGSFKLAQRAMPTADNVYGLDRWRMLTENANGYVVTQDTADIPTGATHACKMVVGSGNNGKFGIWQVLESIDCKELAGQTVSILVPIKSTAGIADVRIGVVAFTGTADSVSGDPISAWGAAGTNPTLAASYAFANTPANISPTTSWADYSVTNISISASMTNLAIFIWSDDRTTTTTTDILRVGGYVTLCKGATAPSAQVRGLMEEYELCKRYCQKTFALGSAPAQNFGTTDAISFFQTVGASTADLIGPLWYPSGRMRTAPTITTYNPSAANAQARSISTSSDCSATSPTNITNSSFTYSYTTAGGTSIAGRNIIHFLFESEL